MADRLSFWHNAFATAPTRPETLATPAWYRDELTVRLDNCSGHSLALQEWILLDEYVASPDCAIYGEGFQMLAQTGGCWGAPEAIGRCPDASVYRITSDQGYHTVHNLLMFKQGSEWTLLAFVACERFGGEFRLYPDGRLQVVMRTEGLELAAGAHWCSEPLVILQGDEKASLLASLARHIQEHHPALPVTSRPTGWCSWYHYYADVTASDIQENVQQLASRYPQLRYVQIDDGYQKAMGDWLIPSERFAGGLMPLLDDIRSRGALPALWVAPFIAEPGSEIFRQHPDWFVKCADGQPLAAEMVTYGGWRCTPWYVLDATHPEVQQHLTSLFSTLRHEFGITYFKLDANFWGAIHGGCFHDRQATRIEAYRRGMQAIIAGVGEEAFLLGCNAPIWPSLGLVHGMRVGDDIERSGHRIRQVAREIFSRSWQAERLWQLDPDCLCLRDLSWQHASAADYQFHMATLLACGGMVLSGDRLADLDMQQSAWLTLLTQMAEQRVPAATFNADLSHGELQWGEQTLHFFFNWHDTQIQQISLPEGGTLLLSAQSAPAQYALLPGCALVVSYPLDSLS